MKNSYCIYCHTFPNGKMYFGQTNQKPQKSLWLNELNETIEMSDYMVKRFHPNWTKLQ